MRRIAFPHPQYPSTHARDSEFKALFGLTYKQKWPKEGLPSRAVFTSDGLPLRLWVIPLSPRARQGVPRLVAKCPRCGCTYSGGRIQQHYVKCKS